MINIPNIWVLSVIVRTRDRTFGCESSISFALLIIGRRYSIFISFCIHTITPVRLLQYNRSKQPEDTKCVLQSHRCRIYQTLDLILFYLLEICLLSNLLMLISVLLYVICLLKETTSSMRAFSTFYCIGIVCDALFGLKNFSYRFKSDIFVM